MPQNYPSPATIRNRRIVGLLILAALIWGIVAGVGALFGWVGSLFNQNQTPTIAAGDTCQSQQIRVDAHVGTVDSTNQLAFNPSDVPYFWFSITNTGSVECKFNVGADVSFFKVTSGSDSIWSSKDCNSPRVASEPILLLPNQEVSAGPSSWDRVRSTNSGCSATDGLVAVASGGASYVLEAEVNGVLSNNKPQFVLN